MVPLRFPEPTGLVTSPRETLDTELLGTRPLFLSETYSAVISGFMWDFTVLILLGLEEGEGEERKERYRWRGKKRGREGYTEGEMERKPEGHGGITDGLTNPHSHSCLPVHSCSLKSRWETTQVLTGSHISVSLSLTRG